MTLVATADANSSFVSWAGCDAVDGVSCTLAATSDRTVDAQFVRKGMLTVNKTGDGTGTVSGLQIDCGSDCSGTYENGTEVRLSAAPGMRSVFDGWSGCDSLDGEVCVVTLNGSKTVTAEFGLVYDLSVSVNTLAVSRSGAGAAFGTIYAEPAGISCGVDCGEDYSSGTAATLTALGSGDASFLAWTGACTGSENECTVTMTRDLVVGAIFQVTATLTPVRDNLALINSQNSGTANTAFPTGELAVGCNWTYSSLTGIQDFVCAQSLVQFNTVFLSGRQIVSATLKLDVNYTGSNSRSWQVRALATGWGSNVTWNSAGALQYYTASPITLSPPAGTALPYEVNLTTYVRNWADGSWEDRGINLISSSYQFPYATALQAFAFYSSEDHGVELEVTYY